VAPLLRKADLAIGNLEVPLTTASQGTPHKSAADIAAGEQYILKGPPGAARCIADAGIDVATLGTNHIMDYRWAGCKDTIEALNGVGVATCGAGANEQEARRPAVVEAGSAKVAVLSYLAFMTAGGLGACTPASKDGAGVAVVRSGGGTIGKAAKAALKADIAAAKQQADIVIVAFHWGIQKQETPRAYHRGLGRTAAELGATAVIGHHPHVLQGIEWYGGRPILFSLGNFVFSPSAGALGETGVFYLRFSDNLPTRVDFHPARIDGRTPKPLSGDKARGLSERLLKLSRGLGTRNGVITKEGVLQIPKP
jgi:poly-gamma-glutamate synthesis protein (capsule biosynthesis protein)